MRVNGPAKMSNLIEPVLRITCGVARSGRVTKSGRTSLVNRFRTECSDVGG